MGVGFGAAYMLGLKSADAALGPDAMVSLKSTNPALNDIIEENQQSLVGEATPDGEPIQSAQLEYARGDFKRAYGKEYKKGYTKLYGKEYTKGYTKLYGKEYKKGFGRLYSKGFARIYKKV